MCNHTFVRVFMLSEMFLWRTFFSTSTLEFDKNRLNRTKTHFSNLVTNFIINFIGFWFLQSKNFITIYSFPTLVVNNPSKPQIFPKRFSCKDESRRNVVWQWSHDLYVQSNKCTAAAVDGSQTASRCRCIRRSRSHSVSPIRNDTSN